MSRFVLFFHETNHIQLQINDLAYIVDYTMKLLLP
jgi:hypothetical protein